MLVIVGSIVVLASVAGGYMWHGGQLLALHQPSELLIIFGAALGALIIANPMSVPAHGRGGDGRGGADLDLPRHRRRMAFRQKRQTDLEKNSFTYRELAYRQSDRGANQR